MKLPVPELGLPIPELKPSVSELGLEKAQTQSEQDVVIPQNIQTSSDASESEEEETTAAATEVALPVVTEEIEKPVLKVKDIPEQPPIESTRDMNLEQHMKAAEAGIEPPAEIMTRLLQHSAYSIGMSALIKSEKWEVPTTNVEAIPSTAKQLMEELKQRRKQNKYRVSGNAT